MKQSSLFLLFFFVYYLSSEGPTPYNYFVLLADAFIHGRYYLLDNPPWLSELIPVAVNKFYTVYPPGPALLLTPFVLVFGTGFQQQLFAHILGALMVVASYELARIIDKKNQLLHIWTVLLVGIGNITWFMSSVGSVWYLGQITAASFMIFAILSGYKKKLFLTGLFLGIAYVSRVHTILTLPFYVYLLRSESKSFRRIYRFAYPLGTLLLFDAFYNFIRFGTPFNKGYFLLPGVLGEEGAAWFARGVVHYSYYFENFRTMFLMGPKFLPDFPYVQPSWYGLSILLTTPAFVFAFWARRRDGIVKFAWLSIILVSLVVMSHGGTGWTQFGYRFAVDFYPFLILLTIMGVSRMGLRKIHWVVLFFGVFVNLWGVLWINKFHWVSL